MRVMRKHDLTNKKTITKTKTMTKTMTKTFRERPQRVILETYDLWDIWSERWGDMTWPTKRQWQWQTWRRHGLMNKNAIKNTMIKTNTMTNTFREHPQRALLETWWNQIRTLCSPWMTRANRSALFPPVHQRMTGMRLFPRAGQVINAQCSWHKKHSISGKENSKTIH